MHDVFVGQSGRNLTQGTLLTYMGGRVWNHPNGAPRRGGHNFNKAIAEVATVELFAIIK